MLPPEHAPFAIFLHCLQIMQHLLAIARVLALSFLWDWSLSILGGAIEDRRVMITKSFLPMLLQFSKIQYPTISRVKIWLAQPSKKDLNDCHGCKEEKSDKRNLFDRDCTF